jgi:undecaprenyl-diphosphatase
MKKWILALIDRIEFPVLVAGLLVAGGLWGFEELMEVARDASPHGFDTQILLAFREAGRPDQPIGPFWLEEAMRDITSLGSTVVLALATLAVVIYLALVRRPATALFVLVAVVGGQVLSSLAKRGIDRPRPELVSHLVDVHSLSFPSGHAMLSAVTYLTLGSLATRFLPGRATKIYVLSLAVLTTLLVGISRVYLGVHWPSDVLAGWCAGFAWAMLCWLAAWFWQRRMAAAIRDPSCMSPPF